MPATCGGFMFQISAPVCFAALAARYFAVAKVTHHPRSHEAV
ncbi:hypothetical protein CEV31_1919 [Brucella thiophenivorans]|uniref:Uncharacterized protein n=1 Tax=Brucella thiophenivorans TaxID=571255 RepID=A0A256FWX6_9HYPH|nr:hypothetical protein CEV31_1919 [Brucella thiophenivorans]